MERSGSWFASPFGIAGGHGRSTSAIRAFGVVGALIWLAIVAGDASAMRLGWLAFLVGALGVLLAFPRHAARYLGFLLIPRPVIYVTVLAVAAFGASLAFVLGPMANKAVSIDANLYLFEGRMLSEGVFGAAIPPPRLAYASRFLLAGPDGHLYGVFPPGYPFFLAPFVRLGIPLLSGPVTAALWVFAQNALGRAVLRASPEGSSDAPSAEDGKPEKLDGTAERARELGHRIALLLPLFTFERTLHTADLLSHAFVSTLAAFALASALDLATSPPDERAHPSPRRVQNAITVGALCGWIFAARLLDGVLIGGVIAAVLVVGAATKRIPGSTLALALAASLPFLALLAAQQKAATGSPTLPTQTEYFVRSDWPPTCHRVGFGKDVGCTVEHPDSVEKIGPDGYGPADAARVIRERGGALGRDLFGVGALGLLAFWLLVRRPRFGFAACAAMALSIVCGYGLFYFGNVQWYGGRHVLPAAPFLFVLVGHGLTSFPVPSESDAPFEGSVRAQLAFALAAIVTMLLAGQRAWTDNLPEIEAKQSGRSDVRQSLAKHHIDRGIFRSSDGTALVAALDPVRDGDRIHLVQDDHSGLLDLRRHYPELPLILSLERDEIGTAIGLAPPRPGILVELERAWPTFQIPNGLAASPQETQKLNVTASGGRALFVTHAQPGATLRIPFDVARDGDYRLRLDGIASPASGRYSVSVDGVALTAFDGYASGIEMRRGVDTSPRHLASGSHELTFRCEGKDDASTGYDAAFDALVGTLAEP